MIESALAGARPCEHIADADGAVAFSAACNMGLGILAKRRDKAYRSPKASADNSSVAIRLACGQTGRMDSQRT